MPGFLSKLFKFLSKLAVRGGLISFLANNMDFAIKTIIELSAVRTGQDFHHWKDEAFRILKERTAEDRDNFVALLVSIAFEVTKHLKLLKAPPK